MIDIEYLLGLKKGLKSAETIDVEGGISISEDEDGFVVIEEEEDGE